MRQRNLKNRVEFEANYDELSEALKKSIWEGDACGHPSNRPKSVADARRSKWVLNADQTKIIGQMVGFIGTDFKFHRY